MHFSHERWAYKGEENQPKVCSDCCCPLVDKQVQSQLQKKMHLFAQGVNFFCVFDRYIVNPVH